MEKGIKPKTHTNFIKGLFNRYALITLHNISKEDYKEGNLILKKTNSFENYIDYCLWYFVSPSVYIDIENEEGRTIVYNIHKNSKCREDVVVIIPVVDDINKTDCRLLADNCINTFLSLDREGKLYVNFHSNNSIYSHNIASKITIWGEYEWGEEE